jgi:predicted RecB family nuclease
MITNDTFLSFSHCPRKAYLKTHSSLGEPVDIERVQLELGGLYRQQALEEFLRSASPSEVIRNPASLETALRERPRWIVNGTATGETVSSEIHCLERVEGAVRRGTPAYTPVLFIRNNKISRLDKLLLAFNALALTSVQGVQPTSGKIVHGNDRKALRIKVEPLMHQVGHLVDQIRAVQGGGRAPTVTLNRHCNICEFRNACRKVAEEADDLRGSLQIDLRRIIRA